MKPIEDVSYTPHAWVNAGTTGAFPLNATRANEIEAGIDDCADAINDILDAADDVDKWAAQADVLTYAGRSIADIPEIQTELTTAGSVAAFLNARALAKDSSYLRVGDYVDITHSSIGGTRRYRIGDFWPYAGAGDSARPGGIVMVPDRTWPNTVQWASKGNNNGNSSQNAPYVCSDNTLHNYEINTILPTFPTAWQNVMQNHRALIETRYSASGNLSAANSWAWNDLGKIWSPSETEVYGQVVWGTANGYSVGYDCQFEIFRKTRNRIKTYDGTNRSDWWLRTPDGSYTTIACFVSSYGAATSGSVTNTNIRPLPCFIVGAN